MKTEIMKTEAAEMKKLGFGTMRMQMCIRDRVLSYLEPRLAHYKIPSHVLWFDALPMNASGKVLISELKNQVIDRLKQVEQNNAEK